MVSMCCCYHVCVKHGGLYLKLFYVLAVATPILDVMKAKYVIQHVGDQFCELVEQEKEAMSWVSPDSKCALFSSA